MFEKKKLTRKEIQQKYEDLKIDSHRRQEQLRKEIGDLKLGAAQLSSAVDIILGQVIEAYGEKQDGSIALFVPKSDKRYRITSRVREEDNEVAGIVYIAEEVEDEEIQEHKD